jgi:hypothetical protein
LERLLLFVAGACLGCGFFCFYLYTDLSPSNRPIFPEPALGCTHLIKARYGRVYGTLFEYLAVNFGPSTMLIAAVPCDMLLRIDLKVRTQFRWQFYAASAISIALCYAFWRLSIYVARL